MYLPKHYWGAWVYYKYDPFLGGSDIEEDPWRPKGVARYFYLKYNTTFDRAKGQDWQEYMNVIVRYWFWFSSGILIPSQNKSIQLDPKEDLLRSIIDRDSLNLGIIIKQEMILRHK